MSDLLTDFIAEARELVQQAGEDLLGLERDPADVARLHGAFLAVHTLKGSVALFDLAPMGRVLHAAEDLLEALRAGKRATDRPAIDALLTCIAASEDWIDDIARDGSLPPAAAERAAALEASLRAGSLPIASRPSAASAEPPAWLPAVLARETAVVAAERAAGHALTAMRYQPAADCFFLGDDPIALVRTVPGLVALHLAPRQPWPEANFDVFACNLVIELLSTAPPEALRTIFRLVPDQVEIVALPPPVTAVASLQAPAAPADGQAQGIRVDTARIDGLLDLAGELLVAHNGLAHLVAQAAAVEPRLGRALGASLAGIERLTGMLHRAVMDLRMVPLARSFRRFPRLLRETASQLGKEVALELEGEDVLADRAVVDGLFEPLLHALRNAVDHGIESAAQRAAAGKPATGRVVLSARRESGGIVVEVADDGAGIDPARLRAVAKDRQVLDSATIDAMDDEAALELIFQPGFSTATEVTAISGRGVGMLAVRRAVAALGGRASLTSTTGVGTRLRLVVPQRVSVTRLLTIRIGEDVLGVPMAVVSEIARLPEERILRLQGGEAFVLRDRTLPLLRLPVLLGLSGDAAAPGAVPVLIAGEGQGRVGIAVDEIAGQVEVLLRPLDGLLAGMEGALGTGLLGDGQVVVVLDVAGLVG